MAKLTRKTLKLFGSLGSTNNFAQFGSLEFGTPLKTKDIASIQGLVAWDDGWQDALYSANRALMLEDLNAWSYLHSYMTTYLMQEGVPEWDANTEYFLNSIVKRPGTTQLFGSLQDNNLGNTPPTSTSNAFWEWLNPPIPTSFPIGNGIKENLQVRPNNGAPNSKYDVSADRLSVQGVILTGVSKTADITAIGVDGLDTGTEAPSTWYALHVITNDSGSLVASLLSLSSAAPTLPVNYTKFRRVGWVRNNASGNFMGTIRCGDDIMIIDPTVTDQVNPTSPVTFSAFIPPGVQKIGMHSSATSFPGYQGNGSIEIRPTGLATNYRPYITWFFPAGARGYGQASDVVLLGTGQSIDYSGSSSDGTHHQVIAYTDPV